MIQIAPTLDTNAYATGDRMGSIVTVAGAFPANGSKINILSVSVLDKAKQNAAFEILLFNQLPTIASADNAAIDLTDTEQLKLVGVIPVLTTDYTTAYGSNSQATKMNVNLVIPAYVSSTNLYALLVCRGAPTYAADSLVINIGAQAL